MANAGGSRSGTLTPLPESHKNGLVALSVVSAVSLATTLTLFLHLTARLLRWKLAARPLSASSVPRQPDEQGILSNPHHGFTDEHFVQDPFEDDVAETTHTRPVGKQSLNQLLFLVYNLLLADIQLSLAHVLNAAWVGRNGIFVGSSICWAQGWLISTGDIASSVFNAAIALHTFLFLVLNYKASQRALYFAVILLWVMVYALPLVGIATAENGKHQGGYYVRANSWCWISKSYGIYRLWISSCWMFFSLLLTCLGYIIVFFYVEGAHPPGAYHAHGSRIPGGRLHHAGYRPGFLLFPLIYLLCTAPLAVGRLTTLSGRMLSAEYFCFAGAMWTSNGWLNALLFSWSRGSILFQGSPAMESFGLETFAFMRTPPGRRFGNIVWVQGSAQPPAPPEPKGEGAQSGREGGARGRERSGSQLPLATPHRPTGPRADFPGDTRESEAAIHVDTVTRVEVEYEI